jgi:hypothetical protein
MYYDCGELRRAFHVLVKVFTSMAYGKRSAEDVFLVLAGLSATRMGDHVYNKIQLIS